MAAPPGDDAPPVDAAEALEQAIAGAKGTELERELKAMRRDPASFLLALRVAEYDGLLSRDFPDLTSLDPVKRHRAVEQLEALFAPYVDVLERAAAMPDGAGGVAMQALLARLGRDAPQDVYAQRAAPAVDGGAAGGAAGLEDYGGRVEGGEDREDDDRDDTCKRGARFAQAAQRRHLAAGGLAARLLLEPGASCENCAVQSPPATTRAGVWCCCRRASGERLCYACDAARHLEAPFCPYRIALVDRGHASAVPQRLWPARCVDIQPLYWGVLTRLLARVLT
jgi:hypothetical protein